MNADSMYCHGYFNNHTYIFASSLCQSVNMMNSCKLNQDYNHDPNPHVELIHH